MQRLKELRKSMGLTQAELAKALQTTQQTIARWETGQTEVPTAALRDLATFFGRSADELLGVERQSAKQKLAKRTAQARHSVPFGTLSLGFQFGERRYPIDENERDRLRRKVDELTGISGWLRFVALDNRIVFVNPSAVQEAALISDDAEEMPYFASPDTYRGFTEGRDNADIGPLVAKERQRLMQQLAPDVTDLTAASNAVHEAVTSLKCIFMGGREATYCFEDDIATSISLLEDRAPEIEPNALLLVDIEGYEVVRLVNLSALAVIEAPLEQYLAYLATDE